MEKGCFFLDLWEVLADSNGDLRAEYAQPDGYHLQPAGYAAWVSYLRTHVAHTEVVASAEDAQPEGASLPADSAAASVPAADPAASTPA